MHYSEPGARCDRHGRAAEVILLEKKSFLISRRAPITRVYALAAINPFKKRRTLDHGFAIGEASVNIFSRNL
jgi:hypothetical protein